MSNISLGVNKRLKLKTNSLTLENLSLGIRTILVAVDGSNPSLKASAFAIDIAKRFDAEMIVLHILSPAPYSQFEYANIGRRREIKRIEKQKAQQQILDSVKQKAKDKKVSVRTEVLIKHTSIVKEIVVYAEIYKVDIIVIGTTGKTGFKKLLMGSVAGGVVTYSHCPVLVVK